MRLPDVYQSRPVFIPVGGYFSLLLCITLSAGVYVWHDNMMNVAGPHQDDVLIIIAPGSGHNTLRHVLNRAGVLHQIYHYDVARILAGGAFRQRLASFYCRRKPILMGFFLLSIRAIAINAG